MSGEQSETEGEAEGDERTAEPAADGDAGNVAPIESTGELEPGDVEEPTDLMYVGPATAEVFEDSDRDATEIAAGEISYRQLVDAGVNAGVAAKIRREHSLAWSFDGGDLDRRSEQVWGLEDGEREWVAQSLGDGDDADGDEADPEADEAAWREAAAGDGPAGSDPEAEEAAWRDASSGDWTLADASEGGPVDDAEADGSGDAIAGERAWRERSEPTPVGDLDDVDDDAAESLSEAGITSVRSLATADPELLADVLGRDRSEVETWRDAARAAEE